MKIIKKTYTFRARAWSQFRDISVAWSRSKSLAWNQRLAWSRSQVWSKSQTRSWFRSFRS
jgi:hypothetical protein